MASTPKEDEEQIPDSQASPKVKVHLVAVGSAPLLKQTKFQLPAEYQVAALSVRLRKLLHLDPSASLFLYCQSSFVPGLEAKLGDLRDSFAVREELVIHYSLQEAWG